MHPLFQQVHLQYIAAFTLSAGAIGDLALAIFSEKLVVDRALRLAAAAIMSAFALALATGFIKLPLFGGLLLVGASVQAALFVRTRRASRASEATASVS
ncbi:hypothetical protein [Paraburkholderia youngii]|uniref:hypothetical protein n=1 Tax=Paraburkholderia youngii TaxID=2782701 RepID=UPI003D2283FC